MTDEPPQTLKSEFTTLGAWMEKWRDAAQLEQWEIALEIGVDRTTISSWERSDTVPRDDDQVTGLARVFAKAAAGDFKALKAEALSLAVDDRLKPKADRLADRGQKVRTQLRNIPSYTTRKPPGLVGGPRH